MDYAKPDEAGNRLFGWHQSWGSDTINPDLKVYLDELKTPVLPFEADFDSYADSINAFYDKIVG